MKILQQAIKEATKEVFLDFYSKYLEKILILSIIITPFIISLILERNGYSFLSFVFIIYTWFHVMICLNVIEKYNKIKAKLKKEEKNANI